MMRRYEVDAADGVEKLGCYKEMRHDCFASKRPQNPTTGKRQRLLEIGATNALAFNELESILRTMLESFDTVFHRD